MNNSKGQAFSFFHPSSRDLGIHGTCLKVDLHLGVSCKAMELRDYYYSESLACDRNCAVPTCAPTRGVGGLLSHLFAICGAPDVRMERQKVEGGRRLTWEHTAEEFTVAGSLVTAVEANVPVPVLERRLYLMALWPGQAIPRGGKGLGQDDDAHFFSLDTCPRAGGAEMRYAAFCADFGPYNLGVTHQFCAIVKGLLQAPALARKRLVFCTTSPKDTDTTNAIYLLSAFLITHLGASPKDALLPFSSVQPGKGVVGFRDATWVPSTFDLSLLDTSAALAAAMRARLYNPRTFNASEYFYYDEPVNGDLHEVVTGKFIAFKGPSEQQQGRERGPTLDTVIKCPKDYLEVFRAKNVTTVVRLNAKEYDASAFVQAGFAHMDLYYPDCTAPPDEVVDSFLRLAEDSKEGVIAVHCFAGLGRTGTLIGLWMMKHLRMCS